MAPDPTRAHSSASKIAQLLGETIIHHAPWSAEISEETRRRVTDAWLERLEAHATEVVGPFVDQVIGSSDMPPEIASLFEHAARPTAQFGSTIQQFFVYGVMFSLASTSLQPFTQVIANDLWHANPTRPLSPADIATMTVRGVSPGEAPTTAAQQWALDEAAMSGLNAERFQALVDATGNPPAPQDLFQMIRRGIIDQPELELGIKQGDTRDEWITKIAQLRYQQPSPIDMVRAAVQAQMDYDTAKQWATTLGLEPAGYINSNPDWFDLLYDTAGRPPGPVELGHAANRGFIPWTGRGAGVLSFEQGVSESDIKDKWTQILQQLAAYFPPASEVKTLLIHGAITEDQAVQLWQAGGVPTELATAFAHVAAYDQVTTDKALAKGDILTLVQEQAISDDTAADLLQRVGYHTDVVPYLIEMAHFRYNLETLRTAVRRIATLYSTYKISATDAKTGFESLGLPSDQITQLLATLEIQRAAEVTILTAGEIVDAWAYNLVDVAEAMNLLQQLGYTPHDAWVRLSIKNKGPLPDEPPFSGEGR